MCVEFFFLRSQVAFYNLCDFCEKAGPSWLRLRRSNGHMYCMCGRVTLSVSLSVMADVSGLFDLCGHVHVNVYIFYFEQLFLLCFALFSQAAETVSLLAQCTEYRLTHVLPEEDVFFSIAAVTVITIQGTGLSITGCFSCICTQTLPVVFSFLCRNPPRSCKPPSLWFPVLDSQVERSVSIDFVVNPVCRSYISLLVIQDQCGGLWAAEQSCSVEDLLFCLSYHNTIC